MVSINHNGIKIEWTFPKFIKRLLMKQAGLCAKEHSEHPGYFCVKSLGHDGWCGCA